MTEKKDVMELLWEKQDFFEKEIFLKADCLLHERRTVIVRSLEKAYLHYINYSLEQEEYEFIFQLRGIKSFFKKFVLGKDDINPVADLVYPKAMNIEEAIRSYRFPPGHPIDGLAYTCPDIEPNLYIPVASIHDYMFQSKMNSFMDLCSCLNAKYARIDKVEEDGKEITGKLDVEDIPSQVGVVDGESKGLIRSKALNGVRIEYTFPNSNKISIFESPWLLSEPSWQVLNKVRKERDVNTFQVEVNHDSNFGIDGNLVAKLEKMGASMGGTYTSFKKYKLVYDVEFWPT